MTPKRPSYPPKVWSLGQLLGVCDLLTRISADLSDVFSDMSEVTSHKAAVILAVVRTPAPRGVGGGARRPKAETNTFHRSHKPNANGGSRS